MNFIGVIPGLYFPYIRTACGVVRASSVTPRMVYKFYNVNPNDRFSGVDPYHVFTRTVANGYVVATVDETYYVKTTGNRLTVVTPQINLYVHTP